METRTCPHCGYNIPQGEVIIQGRFMVLRETFCEYSFADQCPRCLEKLEVEKKVVTISPERHLSPRQRVLLRQKWD